MKALVTGATGFLGRHLVHGLLQRGWQVASFARGSYPDLQQLGVEVIRGDLADADAVHSACRNREVVFHVAAKAGIWGNRDEFYQTNVLGTENVIKACRQEKVHRC